MNNDLPIFSKPTIHPTGWGEERHIFNGPEYCGKILYFKKGAMFSDHFHAKKESFLILRGTIIFKYYNLKTAERLERELSKGDVITIPPFIPHQVLALEETEIAEFSTQDFPDGSYRIGKGDSQIT